MDAFTSIELEAQRRREVLEMDRRAAVRVRAETPVDGGPLARVVVPAVRVDAPRVARPGEGKPAVATR
jgi:hypothetical protein